MTPRIKVNKAEALSRRTAELSARNCRGVKGAVLVTEFLDGRRYSVRLSESSLYGSHAAIVFGVERYTSQALSPPPPNLGLGVHKLIEAQYGLRSVFHVRRDKAALFQWVQGPP